MKTIPVFLYLMALLALSCALEGPATGARFNYIEPDILYQVVADSGITGLVCEVYYRAELDDAAAAAKLPDSFSPDFNNPDVEYVLKTPKPNFDSAFVEITIKNNKPLPAIEYLNAVQKELSPFVSEEIFTFTAYGIKKSPYTDELAERITERYLDALSGKAVSTVREEGHLNILARSPVMGSGVYIGGEEVNINIAVRGNERETRVYLATPFLSKAY